MSVLSSVLVPSPSDSCEVSQDNLAGKTFGTAMVGELSFELPTI